MALHQDIMDALVIAAGALRTRPLRSLLALLGVAVAVAASVAVLGAEQSWQQQTLRLYEDFGPGCITINPPPSNAKVTRRSFRMDDAEAIRRQCPSVRAVAVLRGPLPVDVQQGAAQARLNGYQVSPECLKLMAWPTQASARTRATPEGSWLSPWSARLLWGDTPPLPYPSALSVSGRVVPLNGLVLVPPHIDEAGEGYLLLPLDDAQARFAGAPLRLLAGSADVWKAAGEINSLLTKRLGATAPLSLSDGPWRYAARAIQGRARLRLFTGAVLLLILLVATLGVTGTLLAGFEERMRELALRRALGARAGHLMGEALLESALLCLLGGAVGLAAAAVTTSLIGKWLFASSGVPIVGDDLGFYTGIGFPFSTHLTWSAAAWGAAISALAALAAACVPALLVAARDPAQTLAAAPPRRHRVARALGLAQVSAGVCAAVVMVALYAGLARDARSWLRYAHRRDIILFRGFEPPVLGARRDFGAIMGALKARYGQFFDSLTPPRLRDLAARTPGVSSVRRCWELGQASGEPLQAAHDRHALGVILRAVDEGLSGDMQGDGVRRLLMGRPITLQDAAQSQPVCVIGKEVQDSLFPTESALGQTLTVLGRPLRVVGVLQHFAFLPEVVRARPSSRNVPVSPDREIIVPISAMRGATPTMSDRALVFTVDVGQDPTRVEAAIAASLRRAANLAPQEGPSLTSHIVRNHEVEQRVQAMLARATLIGSTGLWVALIGMVNVLFSVFQARTREIAVLRALGATRGAILRAGVMEALALSLAGMAIGVPLAQLLGMALGRMAGLPIQVLSPWVLTVLAFTLVANCLAALLPSRRAASVDPAVALRHQ